MYFVRSDSLLKLKMRLRRSLGICMSGFFSHCPALPSHLFPACLIFPGNCGRRGPWVLSIQLKSSSSPSGCRTCSPSTTSSIQFYSGPQVTVLWGKVLLFRPFSGKFCFLWKCGCSASFSFCKLSRGEVEISTAQLWAGSAEGNKACGFQWILVAARLSGVILAHTQC